MLSWFVYIIRCKDGSLYTGCTNHILRRWHQHNSGKGAKYLRAYPPVAMVYIEECVDRSEASQREYQIKQYSKQEKEELIAYKL